MKRLSIFFIFIICLITALATNVQALNFKFNEANNVYIYSNNKISNLNSIKNGNAYITKCSANLTEKFLTKTDEFFGLTLEFDLSFQEEIFSMFDVDIKSSYEVNSMQVVEGYSPVFDYILSTKTNGNNVQIAFTTTSVLIGAPAILHGF